MIAVQRITAPTLKELPMGVPITFKLPSYAAIDSARTMATRYGARLGCKFAVTADSSRLTITITRCATAAQPATAV